MKKEEFIKKWGTNVFEKAGITEGLSQQLSMEFRKDLNATIKQEKVEVWKAVSRLAQKMEKS